MDWQDLSTDCQDPQKFQNVSIIMAKKSNTVSCLNYSGT